MGTAPAPVSALVAGAATGAGDTGGAVGRATATEAFAAPRFGMVMGGSAGRVNGFVFAGAMSESPPKRRRRRERAPQDVWKVIRVRIPAHGAFFYETPLAATKTITDSLPDGRLPEGRQSFAYQFFRKPASMSRMRCGAYRAHRESRLRQAAAQRFIGEFGVDMTIEYARGRSGNRSRARVRWP